MQLEDIFSSDCVRGGEVEDEGSGIDDISRIGGMAKCADDSLARFGFFLVGAKTSVYLLSVSWIIAIDVAPYLKTVMSRYSDHSYSCSTWSCRKSVYSLFESMSARSGHTEASFWWGCERAGWVSSPISRIIQGDFPRGDIPYTGGQTAFPSQEESRPEDRIPNH